MIANRPDWTLSRQRQWGVPLPFFLDKETDELHPDTLALLELAAPKVEHGGIEAWFEATHEDFGVDAGEVPQDHRHARRLVRLRLDATRRCWAAPTAATTRRARTRRTRAFRPTSTSKAPTSTAAGSIRRC